MNDVPMEVGRRFFPRAEIRLPALQLPRLPDLSKVYPFDVERRARIAYDTRNQKSADTTDKNNTSAVTLSNSSSVTSMTNEVLLPSRPELSVPVVAPVTNSIMNTVSFEEFEGKGSVFDELEWSSIDNRQALSQILGGSPFISSSEPATPVPPQASAASTIIPSTYAALPSYPILSFGSTSTSGPSVLSSTASGSVKYTAPSTSAPPSRPPSVPTVSMNAMKANAPASSSGASANTNGSVPLRTRLLTKGYRENLVSCALQKLPRERIVHVEYYMKSMSLLEKRGVDPAASLDFLIDCAVTDKQVVLQRAQTADQLIGMGFDVSKVFPSLLLCHGDRLKAVEHMLQT